MRITTELLMAHMPESLALLVEALMGAPQQGAPITEYNYFEIVRGGHAELVNIGICLANQKSLLKGAVCAGDADLVARGLQLGADDKDALDSAILVAAAHGAPNELISMLVDAGGDPDSGMAHAGAKGNMRIIEHLAALGARRYNAVLAHATGAAHLRAMQWAISRGADNWDYALSCAAGVANKPMSIMCLHNGADPEVGLRAACGMGYPAFIKLARFFVSRGATGFNKALAEACEGGTYDGIKYLLESGATECPRCHESIEAHRDMYPQD